MKDDRYILVQKSSKNGVSMFILCSLWFFFSFFILPPLSSLHSLFSKIFFSDPRTYYLFLFAHPLLLDWNRGMITKTKILQLRARRTCLVWEVSVPCTQNVRLTIHHSVLYFVPFFFTTKAGFANIFEIKSNRFFKLN